MGQRESSGASLDSPQVRYSLRTFSDVYQVVENNYAEPVNPDKAIYNGAIPGMLSVLDPHSTFFDPKAYAQLQQEQSGKYAGVGMSIGARADKVVVIAPFVGSPAYKAGIHPGDVIVAIDGKPTDNMSTGDVADHVRGPRGSSVQVTVLRQGTPKPIVFTLTRADIPQDGVDVHFLIRPQVGYVHIAMFNETTDRELQQALDQFGDLKGLILDLRQDPGGLLKEAVAVGDKFLPKGAVIVSQRGRASPEQVYRAKTGNGGKNFPIVVLVNRGTASAAEIVSGALQDHDRALIAGENTFGKGLVQTVFPLSEDTGLALTTAKYYTPSGRLIQRKYEGVSLYDYYYDRAANDNTNNPDREVKATDSGRPVYGGDGITPDIKIPNPKLDAFQQTLLQHYAAFDFALQYLNEHKITPQFQVDEPLLQEFRSYLTAHNIPFTEADIARDHAWLVSTIKSELFTDAFGQQQGYRVRAASDPQVIEALNLLPKASALQRTARQIIARRSAEASKAASAMAR